MVASFAATIMRKLLTSIGAGLALMRLPNCAMSAAGVWLGAGTVNGAAAATGVLAAMACAALITAGGNTVNDCLDVRTDETNHPARPLPSRRIAVSTAWAWAVSELGLGVALGFAANAACGAIAVVAVAILLAYEVGGLKREGLPGNVMIGVLTGLLFVTGGAAAGDPLRPASLAVLAILATIGREIVKDIDDMAGDRSRRTWPMSVGVPRARMGAAVLFGLAVVLSPLPWWLSVLGPGYLVAVAVADTIFVRALLVLFSDRRAASRTAKLAMAAVLVAFLAGVLT